MILAIFALLVLVFVILPIVGVAIAFVIRTAIVGLIIGAIGRLLVPGSQPIGALATICCGLIGALIGGGIGHGIGLGWLSTTLIEIGVSAASVAVWAASGRSRISGRRTRALRR